MAPVRRANPTSLPPPAGKYSHLSVVPPGVHIATFSGQVGATHGPDAIPSAVEDQARLVFAHIDALLASQGAAPEHLIATQTLVVGREHLAGLSSVRDEVYARWFPSGDYPANTLVLVAGLAHESLLVEIEGSFVCP